MYWDSLTATGVYASILILVSVAYLGWRQRPRAAKSLRRERWLNKQWMNNVMARFRAFLSAPHRVKWT